MANNLYVHYGCGFHAPDSWRNFDASPTLRFERLPGLGGLYTKNRSRFPASVEPGDIVKGLPVPEGSCRAVYCSHVLEHLALEDFRVALRNTYRMLAPGGVFRMVLPDLERAIRNYLDNDSPEPAIGFMKETLLGREKRSRGIKGLLIGWLGNSEHLWMWDYKSLEYELGQAGFKQIRRARFGDSGEPRFQDVEERERWEKDLGVECMKP